MSPLLSVNVDELKQIITSALDNVAGDMLLCVR